MTVIDDDGSAVRAVSAVGWLLDLQTRAVATRCGICVKRSELWISDEDKMLTWVVVVLELNGFAFPVTYVSEAWREWKG